MVFVLLLNGMRDIMELNLKDEATLEGTVEVASKIGGGNEDAIKVLHLLQDDVLHGIVHLLNRGVKTAGGTFSEDTVGLIEEEDGWHLAVATDVAIAAEDGFNVLLALTNILVTHTGDVNLHEVTTRLTGILQYGLGLACARSAIEQAGKALAHALLGQSLLNRRQVVGAEQTGEAVYLLLLRSIEEQRLLLDGSMALQEAVIGSRPPTL